MENPEQATCTAGAVPRWFEYAVLVTCGGVLSFGGFGLLLGVLGKYSGPRALLLGSLGTVIAVVLGRPVRAARPASGSTPAACMVGVSAALAGWNALFASRHVLVDRDPGTYAVAARWMAQHGNLVVPAGAPWSGKGLPVTLASEGIHEVAGGRVQFQFAHFLPALLAEGHGLGGDPLMFVIPALLGMVALWAMYAVGCRVISRPWVVLAAVGALGVSLPQVFVNRDTYSEPATQVLLWGGIWLLIRAVEDRGWGVAFLAGLAIGGTVMTRIDALAYLIPLPLLGALARLAAPSAEKRRSIARLSLMFVLGALGPAALGVLDVQRRSADYYRVLHGQIVSLQAAVVASVVIAAVLAAAWPKMGALRRVAAERRTQFAHLSVWVISIGLILAWGLRPSGPKALNAGASASEIALLQRAENLPVHPLRSYDEWSLRWIGWYIGPVALVLAIAGLSFLTVRAIQRGHAPVVILLLLTGPLTALYLWRPSITPDQLWAMRRYIPASLPLFMLAAAAAIDAAATLSAASLRNRAWPGRVVATGVIGLVAFPLGATVPVREAQAQAGYLTLVHRTCATVGRDGAVLVPEGDDAGAVLSQTLRSWCNVPVAQLAEPAPPRQLPVAAAAFRAERKTLWVLSFTAKGITNVVPGAVPTLIGTVRSKRNMARTLSRPPENYAESTLTVYAARVPIVVPSIVFIRPSPLDLDRDDEPVPHHRPGRVHDPD